ncbi:MAG: hypothetical protein NC048_03535 [Bacteroides sp.]|nr:hypothetical protein [Ruminococcus flavefaciens]MCM1554547.1 hypothetical protein [Bacteroides sp.]
MKNITILFIALSFFLVHWAQAQKNIESKVEVTLKDGALLKGELLRYWFGPFKGEQNKSFTIIDDNGNKEKLTADNILRVRFLNDPEASVFETSEVAVPALFDSRRTLKWILGISGRSEHATVYWWNYLNSNETHFAGTSATPNITLHSTGAAVCYGIKIEGSDVVYPFYYPGNGDLNFSVMTAHLQKSNPQWISYLKTYLKKNKAVKKQLKENPVFMLDIYESFIATSK